MFVLKTLLLPSIQPLNSHPSFGIASRTTPSEKLTDFMVPDVTASPPAVMLPNVMSYSKVTSECVGISSISMFFNVNLLLVLFLSVSIIISVLFPGATSTFEQVPFVLSEGELPHTFNECISLPSQSKEIFP